MKDTHPHLQAFIRHLQKVPYLASKNIYRVAEYFITLPGEQRDGFIQALQGACNHTIACQVCRAWKEAELPCFWCTSPRRNHRLVCVVETWHDLCAIERAGGFDGVFHVLGGRICPLEGIGPEDLAIEPLLRRVAAGTVGEIVLALNQTIEGEVTSTYITKKLIPYREQLHITTLSRGVPAGSALEYMDRITISKALAERRPL